MPEEERRPPYGREQKKGAGLDQKPGRRLAGGDHAGPVAIGEHAWEQEKNNGTDVLREPDHLGDGEASDIGGICDLVLRGIGIGMGVAVTVLGTLNAIQSSTAFIMLGVGLTAVSISVMKKM
jgi:hypothetical protein